MFLIDGTLHWSASDLTASAECEFAVLRTLDYKLGWADPIDVASDPLQVHIAALGDRHEERLLRRWQEEGDVVVLPHLEPPYSAASLAEAAAASAAALATDAQMVYQAAFFDGEFFGYADFVERADDGWCVCDAKLARSAKPKALLQLGAYADQLRALGLPVSATVSLLLGSGERADFPLVDVLPAFEEQRDRLRALLSAHREGGVRVAWGDDRVIACGRCAECAQAAALANDVLIVAGLRMDQRRKLRAAGIATIGDLAGADASARPAGMAAATFDKLRAQAALQWRQLQEGAGVRFELTDGAAVTLARLPAPSSGDLFFDFEGDPLYDEGDPAQTGLEYLWGVLDADGAYTPTWAHDRATERDVFAAFVDAVAQRRVAYPDMHVYHYAPYETSALKRLAIRYQTQEEELDDLLRAVVFVDLYATVRGAIRVSAPSYSIKKLEPLYMGDELRADDDEAVADGGGSVVAYHQYREVRDEDPAGGQARLDALADYNAYDCRSTRGLRDWLLDRATQAGVRELIRPWAGADVAEAADAADEEPDPGAALFDALMSRSGPSVRGQRSDEEQAHAMLAAALAYFRREAKQFWWGHFDRLSHPVGDWPDERDVFVVESAQVVGDWAVPAGRATNARRVVRMVGDWTPGSTGGSGSKVVYAAPGPPSAFGPEGAPYAALDSAAVEQDPDDPHVVLLTESRKPGETFDDLPVALMPGPPPDTRNLQAALRAVADEAAAAAALPDSAALDVLARRAPRTGSPLVSTGDAVADIVGSLVGMADSYLAVQGPPGSGKTFTGSRVIKELVEQHRWRIGVVAQSHAVVENLLAGVVKAGLDPELVGKSKNTDRGASWSEVKDSAAARAAFLAAHAETGCVLGGTAWTFAHPDLVRPAGLDLLVIDEAGQFSLAPTIAAARVAKRLLLLGDPRQLPQVSQGTHPEPVDESALGWLMGDRPTIPADRGYFLAQSFRMHPALCERVSTLSYERRLQAAPAASKRSLAAIAPGLHVVPIGHTGNRTQSPQEAVEVVAQVRAAIGALWTDPDDATTPRPLEAGDFLVVAPYNAQVALIRERLDQAGLSGVRVGTVDKFQGQQAPVAIVSMTASSHGDVPRGMGFLLSRNRVNVAVSRAQWRAVVIRSEALTAYLPSTADGVLELGAFIGLCR